MLAVFLTVTAIILQYAVPHGGSRYDTPLAGHLTPRVLALWVVASVTGAVFGWPLLVAACAAAWRTRAMTMDTLVSISSGVAYVYAVVLVALSLAGRDTAELGEPPFETVAILLGLVAVGREIEASAKRQTASAVAGLARLQRVDAVVVSHAASLASPAPSACSAAPATRRRLSERILAACCADKPELATLSRQVCRLGARGTCSSCTVGCCVPGTQTVGCSAECLLAACCEVVTVCGCTEDAIGAAIAALVGRAVTVIDCCGEGSCGSTVDDHKEATNCCANPLGGGCGGETCGDRGTSERDNCCVRDAPALRASGGRAAVCDGSARCGGDGGDTCCGSTPSCAPTSAVPAPTAVVVLPPAATGGGADRLAPELLHIGDVLVVGPAQHFPADGVVTHGSSCADESIVTGEAVPVAKVVGDTVIGGTTNGDGLLHVRVTALPSTGTVSRIIALINDAQAQRPQMQHTADLISAWFTPFVLAAGVVTFVAWVAAAARGHVATGSLSPAAFSLQFALSLIVVSCPCAIGLAVPTVIMVATSVGARNGLLIKSGVALEAFAHLRHIVFDKTGTLTSGRATVQQVAVADAVAIARLAALLGLASSADEDSIIAIAAAAAEGSTHPLAVAVAAHATSRGIASAVRGPQERTAVSGKGVRATLGGARVLLGSPSFLEAEGVPDATARVDHVLRRGLSVVCVAADGVLLAAIGLVDVVRPEAAAVMAALGAQGIRVWVASGDRVDAVAAAAAAAGVPADRVLGGLSPADKATLVARLQADGSRVAMVGDGVNDAVALTAADVGVAMGAGTAVAMDCADVVVKGDSLHAVLTLTRLAHEARRRILVNFAWAGVYNIIAMPLAAGVLFPAVGKATIPPAFAGLSELLSSVPVVLGSLLLYRFRPSA